VVKGEPAPFTIEIPPSLAGERIDRALAALRPDLSRSTLQRWIEDGRVTIDGSPIEPKHKARRGARVLVRPMAPPASAAVPQDIPLRVVYDDEHLAVIDKPAGLVVHPAPGHASGTLVNALLHRYRLEDGGDPARPGIVHRLDKDTSGLMVVALSEAAKEHFRKLFAKHEIEREYLAIASGAVRRATYDTLHARHPRDRKRFTTKVSRGRRAVTHVEPVEALAGATLVRCRLETGRTHQIRVHLAEHGHPLLGDPVYGSRPRDPRVAEAAAALGRQALHAGVLGFPHPTTGRLLRFEAPAPADLEEAIRRLRPARTA
jgi:23S rRNA pseudouridine1911/1915/1917 synthase